MKQFSAVLSNPAHPEYGAVTIPFPIPDEQYSQTLEQLETLEIGDAVHRDCQVDGLTGSYPILKRLETMAVNVDELDYLAKRLDSFDSEEAVQFQALACKLGTENIQDFINLTFCCQQATVITNFSDLERIGRDHCLNIHGGSMPMEEYRRLDGRREALKLILNGEGTVTPYGVVYDNGIKLELFYTGHQFPPYLYGMCKAAATVSPEDQPDRQALLSFPCPERVIDRTLARLGITEGQRFSVKIEDNKICDALTDMLDAQLDLRYYMQEFNQAAHCCKGFDYKTEKHFREIVDFACPQTPFEVLCLAENIQDFKLILGVGDAGEYGHYLVEHMENMEPELLQCIDYEKYGGSRARSEHGAFIGRSYVIYRGDSPEVKEMLGRLCPDGQSHGLHFGQKFM